MGLDKKQLGVACAFLIGLTSPTLVAAKTSDNDTINGLITEALENNRDLAAMRWVIREAEGRLEQAGRWSNPELELARNTDRTYHDEGEYTASVGFIQKFPVSGRLRKETTVAQVDVALARTEVREKERELLKELLSNLFALCITEKQLTHNEHSERILQSLVKTSEQRLAQAEIAKTDLNLEKIELQKIKLSSATLKVSKETLRGEIQTLVGGKHFDSSALRCSSNSYPAKHLLIIPSEEAAFARPDLQRAQLSNSKASAEVTLAKAEAFQDWSIGVGYERDVSTIAPASPDKTGDDFLGVRLSIPLPLWNQNEGRIREAKATEEKSAMTVEAIKLRITQEIEAAKAKVLGLTSVLSQYEEESLPLSEQNIQLLNQSYRDGLLPISTVIQGQQQLFDVHQNYSNTLREYLLAVVELEYSLAANPFLKRDSHE